MSDSSGTDTPCPAPQNQPVCAFRLRTQPELDAAILKMNGTALSKFPRRALSVRRAYERPRDKSAGDKLPGASPRPAAFINRSNNLAAPITRHAVVVLSPDVATPAAGSTIATGGASPAQVSTMRLDAATSSPSSSSLEKSPPADKKSPPADKKSAPAHPGSSLPHENVSVISLPLNGGHAVGKDLETKDVVTQVAARSQTSVIDAALEHVQQVTQPVALAAITAAWRLERVVGTGARAEIGKNHLPSRSARRAAWRVRTSDDQLATSANDQKDQTGPPKQNDQKNLVASPMTQSRIRDKSDHHRRRQRSPWPEPEKPQDPHKKQEPEYNAGTVAAGGVSMAAAPWQPTNVMVFDPSLPGVASGTLWQLDANNRWSAPHPCGAEFIGWFVVRWIWNAMRGAFDPTPHVHAQTAVAVPASVADTQFPPLSDIDSAARVVGAIAASSVTPAAGANLTATVTRDNAANEPAQVYGVPAFHPALSSGIGNGAVQMASAGPQMASAGPQMASAGPQMASAAGPAMYSMPAFYPALSSQVAPWTSDTNAAEVSEGTTEDGDPEDADEDDPQPDSQSQMEQQQQQQHQLQVWEQWQRWHQWQHWQHQWFQQQQQQQQQQWMNYNAQQSASPIVSPSAVAPSA